MPVPAQRPHYRFVRILMIEDDELRIEAITSWLPDDVRLVAVRSAGRAIATLKMDPPDTYAGVMLDHDLQMQNLALSEVKLSGTDLLSHIIQRVDDRTPVLVHSMNPGRAPVLARVLSDAGFWTIQIPFADLTRGTFLTWLDSVREQWADREA